ncbi:MAG: DUF362 domain-containing protein, partial [Desulforhopalus sp.]
LNDKEKGMDRREFIKKTVQGGIIAGSSMIFGRYSKALAAPSGSTAPYDLVAVKGAKPDIMFDQAMASLGGMSNFVPKGSRVVVKPNIGWDVPPDRGGNTHPKLISRIIEHCLQAGAGEVSVFDHTCDSWQRCYRNSGIERAVKDAGGKIVPGNNEGYYQRVAVPQGKRLTETKVHELVLDGDVFINVPVLKHHSSSMVTIGMKNLMGIVWDRWYWHRNDLHQCIADFVSYRKPTLTVVDAYNVMKQNGPRGVSVGDVVNMKSLIVSTDPVAADAAAALIFGAQPSDIRHIQLAADMGLGRINLKDLAIDRIKM